MNYKRFVLNVVLCFWIANVCAQSKYEIYKINGIVEVISQAQKASKGIQLTEKDKINIGDKASISILDKINCKLYEYDKKGTYNVSQIIAFCTDESNSITNRIINEIRNNILKGDGKNSRSIGAVRRGDIDELVQEQIYAYILNHTDDVSSEESQIAIKLKKHGDEGISLILVNKSEKMLYANVLLLINGKHPSFCYSGSSNMPCLVIEPCSELNLNHIKMADMGQKFLLVCSDSEFDSDGIQYMIDEQLEPDLSSESSSQCYSFVLQIGNNSVN